MYTERVREGGSGGDTVIGKCGCFTKKRIDGIEMPDVRLKEVCGVAIRGFVIVAAHERNEPTEQGLM